MVRVKQKRWANFHLLFVCVCLVFLESRLDFTKRYNLVGRLGGREENHLATITATWVSRIWNEPFQIVRKRGKKWKKTLNTPTVYWISKLKIKLQFILLISFPCCVWAVLPADCMYCWRKVAEKYELILTMCLFEHYSEKRDMIFDAIFQVHNNAVAHINVCCILLSHTIQNTNQTGLKESLSLAMCPQ